MNKRQLIKTVSGKCNVNAEQTGAVIGAVIETIAEELRGGNSINIYGLGRFYPQTYARRGDMKTPTGQSVQIEPRMIPKFKPCAKFKESVAGV